jgi:hypothetical protein
MQANYSYQLYQAQREMTRQEIVAGDVRRGQQAAAAVRAYRLLAHRARAGLMARNVFAGLASSATRG